MRRYETTYILRPNLGEEQFTEIIERTNSIIKDDGGAIINLERWGTKKLAYEIKKETLGLYISFDYAAHGTSVHEMERIFRIDDRVLRYLTIKLADSIDDETIAKEIELVAAALVQETEATEEAAETSETAATEEAAKTSKTPESSETAETEEAAETSETPESSETENAEEKKEEATVQADEEKQDDQDNSQGEK